jgi:ferredoxin
MSIDSPLRSEVMFHLTGRPAATPSLPAGLRPALTAPYRRLGDLRHDFPAVLLDGPGACAMSLTALVDGALRTAAPQGTAGERLRRRALQVERRVRQRVLGGAGGSLRALWDEAARDAAADAGDDTFVADAARVREAWEVDGVSVRCDARWPSRLFEHAWRAAQREKVRVARERIDRLVLRLEAILRADDARAPDAYTAPRLQATFGAAQRPLFDFAAMSRLLSPSRPRGGLPSARRERIEQVLDVLRSQSLFPAQGEAGLVCETTGDALDGYLGRLPAMVALHRALQIGELEADGQYVGAVHDALFASMDEGALSADDVDFFPDVLVRLPPPEAAQQASLLEALASGLPLKVLVQLDDVLERAAPLGRRVGFGAQPSQLATTAMSRGDVFVLQTVASHLLQQLPVVQRGLDYAGPALFCVYAGPDSEAVLPTYLVAAAALQSRAFPSFSYDPAAGSDLATRLMLGPNPQPERDWPVEPLSYADPALQSVTEPVAFTFLDFALCDPRYATHFEPVPRSRWGDALVPAADWLAWPREQAAAALPYVLAVDEADLLCRLVVDERLARIAWRCREQWHRLQELAGVHDSRVERAVARERVAWEARLERERAAAPAPSTPAAVVATPMPAAEAAASPEPEPARNPDEAWVETLRCSSCNECTLAFPAIFAYNEDKQAYLKDRKAATYRQLVEAAEACQVSVIHPGKPLDAAEPGLEELLERAKPFL